jgi:hypothetical protein
VLKNLKIKNFKNFNFLDLNWPKIDQNEGAGTSGSADKNQEKEVKFSNVQK